MPEILPCEPEMSVGFSQRVDSTSETELMIAWESREDAKGSTDMEVDRQFWIGAAATVVIVAAWVFLADRNPDLTYHFAPFLAAAAWPVLSRGDKARDLTIGLVAALGAATVTTTATVALHMTDRLNGPTFWNDGPAIVEAILFSTIAAAWGLRVATRPQPGLLGRLSQ